ncbi:MAG: 4-(cytidine 5'-diphospho)-2-C-methyl-D-erythritol kinase [Campylobacter sp.]|nr:4-(cytidine 5'-diphospho)-2-C-methyl-D-erythritol kinase [Campylobacter sp.]
MKSFAKINVFLKITGANGAFHNIASRFVICDEIYDEISFERGERGGFCIECNKKIAGKNIIQSAYERLCESGYKNELDEFFAKFYVKLYKQIPAGGGLGGGSSNCAVFLKMINDELNLGISKPNLMQIANSLGSDICFFLSGEKSANVSGKGEIIEAFDDEIPPLRLCLKGLFCDTGAVYKEFRKNYFDKIDLGLANKLLKLKSSEILNNFDADSLNDLLVPARALYPDLRLEKGEFLSGSGSSCFKVDLR